MIDRLQSTGNLELAAAHMTAGISLFRLGKNAEAVDRLELAVTYVLVFWFVLQNQNLFISTSSSSSFAKSS